MLLRGPQHVLEQYLHSLISMPQSKTAQLSVIQVFFHLD
jgi:hypothetical protein